MAVSCLISAYYAEPFLAERLRNLHGHERIVVCQQGSAEHKIALDMKPETIITTQDIPTIGKAWNLALAAASQDYVTTANTDDLIYPGGFDRLVQPMEDDPNIGLVFSQVDVREAGHPFTRVWIRILDETGILKDAGRIMERCFIGVMPVWRRSLHEKVGLFDEEMVICDWDMWVKIYQTGAQFYYIDESQGLYTKRKNSLEWRSKKQGAAEARQLLKRIRDANRD